MWIWTIRINLIFWDFLSLYRPQFTGQCIMISAREKAEGVMRKEMKNKVRAFIRSEPLLLINRLPKQKRIKLMKGNMLQSDDVMLPNMRIRKFQIDPQKFEKFTADEVFSDSDETEEESEEDDNDIDYDQVPITPKFKVITSENNLSNMFYILNELTFNGDSSPDEVRQRIWDWES